MAVILTYKGILQTINHYVASGYLIQSTQSIVQQFVRIALVFRNIELDKL